MLSVSRRSQKKRWSFTKETVNSRFPPPKTTFVVARATQSGSTEARALSEFRWAPRLSFVCACVRVMSVCLCIGICGWCEKAWDSGWYLQVWLIYVSMLGNNFNSYLDFGRRILIKHTRTHRTSPAHQSVRGAAMLKETHLRTVVVGDSTNIASAASRVIRLYWRRAACFRWYFTIAPIVAWAALRVWMRCARVGSDLVYKLSVLGARLGGMWKLEDTGITHSMLNYMPHTSVCVCAD